jgi:hypothetical protein
MEKYHELNYKLSLLTDTEVIQYITVEKCENFKRWGINKTIKLDNNQIFVKAIPLARLFVENKMNSFNLYKIPAYYNYGFASAGVNPWRELLLHIKTTKFVLREKCNFFPLLYHYRIVYHDDNDNIESGLNESLMNRWNNDPNIKTYLFDRINAKYKIVLFLQYIPYDSSEYLERNQNFINDFYIKTKKIVTFCNQNGILHNDAHLSNFIIDHQKNVYLTDFGLSLSTDFSLDENEKKFMKVNVMLDIYYILNNVFEFYRILCFNDENVIKAHNLSEENIDYLINNIDQINEHIDMPIFQLNFIKKNKSLFIKYHKWKQYFIHLKNKNNYFSF